MKKINIDESLYKRLVDWTNFHRRITGSEKTINETIGGFLTEAVNKREYRTKFRNFYKLHSFTIWSNQDEKCYYCKQPMSLEMVTLDHKHPIQAGGKVCDLKNVVACCFWCNSDKGPLTEVEYTYKQLANTAQGVTPPKPYINHPNKVKK